MTKKKSNWKSFLSFILALLMALSPITAYAASVEPTPVTEEAVQVEDGTEKTVEAEKIAPAAEPKKTEEAAEAEKIAPVADPKETEETKQIEENSVRKIQPEVYAEEPEPNRDLVAEDFKDPDLLPKILRDLQVTSLSKSQAATVEYLNLGWHASDDSQRIVYLKGLKECFPNLKNLSLYGNDLEEGALKDLAGLALEELGVSGNERLKTLEGIEGMYDTLTTLGAAQCSLTSLIDLNAFVKLGSGDLRDNYLKSKEMISKLPRQLKGNFAMFNASRQLISNVRETVLENEKVKLEGKMLDGVELVAKEVRSKALESIAGKSNYAARDISLMYGTNEVQPEGKFKIYWTVDLTGIERTSAAQHK